MDSLVEMVERSLAMGIMTQDEHDLMLKRIQQDGEVDEQESALLSKVFAAVQDGRLHIVGSDREQLSIRQREAEAAQAQKASRHANVGREQASRLLTIVEDAIDSGSISQREHDRLLTGISADGKIDPHEKEVLSKLFSAIHSGKVSIVADDNVSRTKKQSERLAEFTRSAIERDEERLRPTPIAEAIEVSSIPTETLPPEPIAIPTSAGTEATSSVSGGLERFFGKAKVNRTTGKTFELENDRLLDIRLNGRVWIKTGSMVAYTGIMRFTREGFTEHGVGKLIKKAVTGEGAMLTKATGQGSLYLADRGKKISIIELAGETVTVNGNSLLSFEESIAWDITILKQFAAIWAGGLFNVRMSGQGMLAVTTVGDPVLLRVSPTEPLMTDVNATVAWSGGLVPQFKTDVAANTLIGRTSGETVQMRFEGDGFVIIQPYEEAPSARE